MRQRAERAEDRCLPREGGEIGGKAVEDWELIDTLGMLQQLGAIPAPELSAAGTR